MGYPARKKIRAATACLIVSVLFAAAVTSGVCLCPKTGAGNAAECIFSLDVCGAGASSSVPAQGFDGALVRALAAELYFPQHSTIPPSPDEAVASAVPGVDDKPPEA